MHRVQLFLIKLFLYRFILLIIIKVGLVRLLSVE